MSPTTSSPLDGRAALLLAARVELAEHGHAAISLRAVARRAGMSHAAPKYHFEDRAGLLTAVATEGYDALTAALLRATTSAGEQAVAALGKAYIDFGLTNPALFDLMFRPSELRTTDPALQTAQARATGVLAETVDRTASRPGTSAQDVTELVLTSWALVHGLVVLARDGALQSAGVAPTRPAAAALAHRLADVYTARVFPTPPGTGR